MFSSIPSLTSIVTVHSKFKTPLAITRAATVRVIVCCSPRIRSTLSSCCFSSPFSSWAVFRSSTCAWSASLRDASDGNFARFEKKSVTGRTTLVTASCKGAIALLTARPAAARASSPAR